MKNNSKKIPLIIICGATAIGKTRIAVSLAEGRGEIISADSMQVYKFLDIGTAKPDNLLLKRVNHHLISIVEPDIDFSAYDFICRAKKIIRQIYKKRKIPFVVGGTGLYIRSLINGLSEAPGKNEVLRKKLENIQKQKSLNFLYQKLHKIDPDYAGIIKNTDKIRIIRALEVYYITGQPLSFFLNKQDKQKKYEALWIGLNQPREILYAHINQRTEKMFQQGLIQETKSLLEKGYPQNILKRKGIGYNEVLDYINNKITLEEAIEETKKKTRNYAKRQMTWFRKEKEIKWFQPEEIEKIKKYINSWLN